jgi:hypothetical protein
MGEPSDSVLSLEGWWESTQLTADELQKMADEARLEMKRAVAADVEYWERISSACMMDDPPAAEALEGVKDEFREYAVHWVRQGKGLNLIGDFKAHQQLRQERFDRRQRSKAGKQQAEAAKLARLLTVPATPLPVGGRGGYSAGRGGGSGGRGGYGGAPVDLYPAVTITMNYNPHEALTALSEIDKALEKIDGICEKLPEITKEQRELLAKAYEHMMEKMKEPRIKQRYGYNTSDHSMGPLPFGGDVPSYFANVQDGSIYRRKLLSVAGLRNLIIYGPIIYHQLKERHFSGDPQAYKGDVGLNLMRRVTGNVVDLDSTVLRCTDRATLNAINASNKHKKEPTFANSDQFSKSDQAQEIAINCSLPMLQEFAKMLKLSEKDQQTRRIHPSQVTRPVPVASSNTDRGKHPVWHYINAGQDSFHANVPTMEDVNGALLKAPYHCIQLWLLIHTIAEGADLENRVDDFFENCVVDSCFNMKWKSIEEYASKLSTEGSIVWVLQRVQAANQGIFTLQFFEQDNDNQDKEVAEMVRLTAGLTGRDKQGKVRAITSDEVAAWVRDPSITI